MATNYVDVKKEPGINNVPDSSATSTVTNDIRVAWQDTMTRSQVARTLREIADAILDPRVTGFAD